MVKTASLKAILDKSECKYNLRKETFVQDYNKLHDDEHVFLPIWMATETMSFGTILTLFRGVEDNLQEEIANSVGIQIDVFKTWLLTLNTIRNICAHHSRLWDRELSLKPKLPREKHKIWHEVAIGNNRCFGILTIEKYLLNVIAPQSSWSERLANLLNTHPEIPLKAMGFPSDWEKTAIWKNP
jgi:abortive infection bacteriophage resistance protein